MKNLILLMVFTLFCFQNLAQAWTGKELQESKTLKLTVFVPQADHGLILEKLNIKGKSNYTITEFNGPALGKPFLLPANAFKEIYMNLRKTYLAAKWKEQLTPTCSANFRIDRKIDGYLQHQSVCQDLLPKQNVSGLNQWYMNTISLIRTGSI